jgi:outer membrane protein assembly factor BamB
VVGFTSTEGQIYVQKDSSELLALDLQSGRDYTVDSVVAAAIIGPTGTPLLVALDGSLATVVDRHTRRWDSIVSEQPKRIWGTTGGRLLALIETEAGRRLELFANTGRIAHIELPSGLLAVTRWGDLVAVATDSGVIVQRTDPNRSDGLEFLPLENEVTAMVFSAAGHYLFIATANRELLVVNRFQFTEPEKYPLAHRVEAMRTGPLGRLLLLKPEGRDSLWIAEEAELVNVVSVAGSWQDDLPTIASDGTVLVRQGDDVVAIDPETGARKGRIEGAAGDRWLAIAWDPRRPTLQLAEETATDDQEETTDGEDQRKFYVQLSSTSNLTWAQVRRDELLQAQLRALVLYPTEYYDRYRVVLGPYDTREDADNIGRQLGQPYFLYRMLDPTATNQ